MAPAAPTPRDFQHVAIEAVHRTMNERRANESSPLSVSLRCECECSLAECGDSFEVTMAEYEAVRSHGRRFLVAPDHQTSEDIIVSTSSSYLVIEKVGMQGRIADDLDPR